MTPAAEVKVKPVGVVVTVQIFGVNERTVTGKRDPAVAKKGLAAPISLVAGRLMPML
jgi:hypothetical protein